MFGRSARHRELAVRRETLRLRSGLLRDRLAVEARVFQTPLSWVDRVVDATVWIRRHPEWPVGVAGVLLVVRPRILLRWGTRGLAAWQLWRRARPYVLIARKAWERSVRA